MIAAAARNNAEWCDLVCRSHGLSTRWQEAVWQSRDRTPAFYPDAVTLSATADAEDVLSGMDSSAGCSIKDSFASLDLTPNGFRILFEARWIHRPPRDDVPESSWRVVRTADELRAWADSHGGGEVFGPELLAHPMVTILGRYEGDTLVGGAVANRSGEVVGISNVFAAGAAPATIWPGAADAVSACHPGLSLVGYESGADLDLALAAGFTDSGPLRVWLRG